MLVSSNVPQGLSDDNCKLSEPFVDLISTEDNQKRNGVYFETLPIKLEYSVRQRAPHGAASGILNSTQLSSFTGTKR